MAELIQITKPSEVEELFRKSEKRDVLLLKHSTRCGTSAAVFEDVRDFVAGRDHAGAIYAFLEIPAARDLSDDIAKRTGVRHQSPQVLVLRGGQVVWNASHWRITKDALQRALIGAPS